MSQRPFVDGNRIALFNEIMVSAYLYALISVSDFMGESPIREQCAYALTGIVSLSIFVNLGNLIVNVTLEIRKR